MPLRSLYLVYLFCVFAFVLHLPLSTHAMPEKSTVTSALKSVIKEVSGKASKGEEFDGKVTPHATIPEADLDLTQILTSGAGKQDQGAASPAKSISVKLDLAAVEGKAATGGRGGRKGTSARGSGQTDTTETLAAAAEQMFDVPRGDQSYFATFDATALSTAWAQVVTHQRQVEKKLAQEAGVDPQQVSGQRNVKTHTTTVRTTSPKDFKPGSPSASAAAKPASKAPPKLTPKQKKEMTDTATKTIHKSKLFKRLDPTNWMRYISQQLPLVMYLPCECEHDLQFAKALSLINTAVRKRQWTNRFTFVYVPLATQKLVNLGSVYQVDESIVEVGMCTPKKCPGNKKEIYHRFVTPFPENEPPTDLTISVHEECCGDKFSLQVSDLSHIGFKVDVIRTGVPANEGWRQPLKLSWSTSSRFLLPGGVPALVLDNIPMGVHMEKFKFSSSLPPWSTDENSVTQYASEFIIFLEHFQLGRLPLVVRSKLPPLPTGQSMLAHASLNLNQIAHAYRKEVASKGEMVEVVGSTFRDIVLDPDRDVLLFIYSPLCAASRSLMPLFNQLAKELAGSDRVFIAKLDKTANDLPITGIKISHLPTVLYFPAGDYDSPLYSMYDYDDYNGSKAPHNPLRPHSHFTKEMVLKFMLDHGKMRESWPAKLREEIDKAEPELYIHEDGDHDHHH